MSSQPAGPLSVLAIDLIRKDIMAILAEYIWTDGTQPTTQLRSKTKVLHGADIKPSTAFSNVSDIPLSYFPDWGADGSSTNQASGNDSDIALRPVRAIRDPYRVGNYLVLCEVFTGAGEVHPSNARHHLRHILDRGAASQEPMFGFEQEYTLLKTNGIPAGFPEGGYPGPQGPYYCAIGSSNIVGRGVYEEFLRVCLEAGVHLTGTNWEVMPGQAEFQIFGDALQSTDHVWFARWLLHRASEEHNLVVSLDAKPASGDWNGAGMHTNFSTKSMRQDGGMAAIEVACMRMAENIDAHLAVYGDNYQARLTGDHETCSFKDFRWGVSDRTASIRIPRAVAVDDKGYLEDRRPNANANPYEIASRMLRTICNIA